MDKTNLLKSIYENEKNIASFSGPKRLYSEAKKHRNDITLSDVKSYLKYQDSYTMHGNVPHRFYKAPVHVSAPGVILCADLADVGDKIKSHNKNLRYLLFLLDCFSRKLHVVALKDK